MIIYIHGFASSGFGTKARMLRQYFASRGQRFVAPSLPNQPHLAISTLAEWIEQGFKGQSVRLIGSSLGGYYALHLSERYGLPVVLINPAIHPYNTLRMALGQPIHYADGSRFEWNQSHLDSLRDYALPGSPSQRCLLLLQTGDEILNYQEALDFLPSAQTIVEDGGDHGFQGLERHLEMMRVFLRDDLGSGR